MRLQPLRLTLAAAILTAGFAGAVMAQPYQPIPPPRFEAVPPPPPGPRAVWEPGHWHWNGAAYVWIGGRYIPWRAAYHRYVPGRWVPRGGTWVWIPAHWG